MRNSKFILFTGPSGVGKATVEKILFDDKELKLRLSCSATTREPREGEIDGIHYHFLSKEEFDKKIEADEFIEWNEHFSNKYGTLKSEIKRIQNNGEVPFLEVETIGAKNIIDQYGEDQLISFFLAPPSYEELASRIRTRGTESEEQIVERLARVKEELTYQNLFQNVIINDEVERAAKAIKLAIKGEM